jgi:hypothetical protein
MSRVRGALSDCAEGMLWESGRNDTGDAESCQMHSSDPVCETPALAEARHTWPRCGHVEEPRNTVRGTRDAGHMADRHRAGHHMFSLPRHHSYRSCVAGDSRSRPGSRTFLTRHMDGRAAATTQSRTAGRAAALNNVTSVRDDPTTRRVSMGTCCAVADTRVASLHHVISHHCRPARYVVAIVLQRDGDA